LGLKINYFRFFEKFFFFLRALIYLIYYTKHSLSKSAKQIVWDRHLWKNPKKLNFFRFSSAIFFSETSLVIVFLDFLDITTASVLYNFSVYNFMVYNFAFYIFRFIILSVYIMPFINLAVYNFLFIIYTLYNFLFIIKRFIIFGL
jgi:hypothetical protein